MFKAVAGHSEDIDAEVALDEILSQCRTQLDGLTPSAGVLLCSIDLEHEILLRGIRSEWPDLQLIGCTTDGEMSSVSGYREDSAALLLFASDVIEFVAATGRNVSRDPAAVSAEAIRTAREKAKLDPALCITLPESLTTSGAVVVEALSQALGPGVPVVGGTAGDSHRLQGTLQFHGEEICSDSVPLLLLCGPLVHSVSMESGWRAVGATGIVTRSEGSLVREIDGRPALDFYRRFLGPMGKVSPECPLAVMDSAGNVEHLRASAGVVDEATGSIRFYADIPEGRMVQLTLADRGQILEGCAASVAKAREGYPVGKTPEAGLFFSCASRKLLLGTRTREEFDAVRSVVGDEMPLIGFYTYGEIGPGSHPGEVGSTFHNEAFISVLLGT